MVKNLIFAATIFTIAWSFPGIATAQDENFWIGTFEHVDGGGKEFEQLIVRRTKGVLSATYREEVTAQLYRNFTLTVEVKGDTAYFYYDRCVHERNDDGDPDPCENDRDKKGDLMFTMVKSMGRNKRPIIRTYSGKLSVDQFDHIFLKRVRPQR